MLLKAYGIKTQFSLVRDLPEYEEEAAVPYEPAELQKLFASMDEEETVRYKFFLGTACREQELEGCRVGHTPRTALRNVGQKFQ
jgi:hypothetical protein